MFRLLLSGLALFSPLALAEPFFDTSSPNEFEYGAQFNPVAMIASSDSAVYMSGGFSLFERQKSVEINFPISYKNIQRDDDQFTAVNIGVHYRKYLDDDVNGYYFSGVLGVTHLNSETTKFGVGFGLGYRREFDSGLYWGYGAVVGRYIGENDEYNDSELSFIETIEDDEFMLDIELFKIGILF